MHTISSLASSKTTPCRYSRNTGYRPVPPARRRDYLGTIRGCLLLGCSPCSPRSWASPPGYSWDSFAKCLAGRRTGPNASTGDRQGRRKLYVGSETSCSGSRCFLNYMLRVVHVGWYKSDAHDKGQPAARRGRKAAGLREGRQPGCRKENGCDLSIRFITPIQAPQR
jgi:hypothetical protein